MTNRLLLCAVLVACGSAGPADWSDKPLDVTIESAVYQVPFKLSVPQGWKFRGSGPDREDDPALLVKTWAPATKAPGEPRVSIVYEALPPDDLEGAIKAAGFRDTDGGLIKKEQTATGFVLVRHSKTKAVLWVYVLQRKGDHALACRATQASHGGVPNADAELVWLERLCASLTLL